MRGIHNLKRRAAHLQGSMRGTLSRYSFHADGKGVRVLGYRERRGYSRGPREMHKIICSECGKEDEVPFKPTEGRPVYCRECYAKRRPQRRY